MEDFLPRCRENASRTQFVLERTPYPPPCDFQNLQVPSTKRAPHPLQYFFRSWTYAMNNNMTLKYCFVISDVCNKVAVFCRKLRVGKFKGNSWNINRCTWDKMLINGIAAYSWNGDVIYTPSRMFENCLEMSTYLFSSCSMFHLQHFLLIITNNHHQKQRFWFLHRWMFSLMSSSREQYWVIKFRCSKNGTVRFILRSNRKRFHRLPYCNVRTNVGLP